MAPHVLDNPVWAALNSRQSEFAIGDDRAKRFPKDMSIFAGLAEYDASGFSSLLSLLDVNDSVAVVTPQPIRPSPDLVMSLNSPVVQMVAEAPIECASDTECTPLNRDHIDEVMRLVDLTKPGPFGIRTIDMGQYFGIWEGKQLVAMAGERMRLDGYTEISAVCTHPDHRGRKYSSILIHKLSERIREAQRVPFLHAFEENVSAIRVYEKLGFTKRSVVHVTGLRAASAML